MKMMKFDEEEDIAKLYYENAIRNDPNVQIYWLNKGNLIIKD